MKCKWTECSFSPDCGFLDILKKIPATSEGCSWYRRSKRKNKGVKEDEFNNTNNNAGSKTRQRCSTTKEIAPN